MKEALVWGGEIPEAYGEKFQNEGFLYIKDFYSRENEINEIKEDVYRLIGLAIRAHNLSVRQAPFSLDCFDSGLNEIVKNHRHVAAIIYNAVKKLPSYVRLAHSDRHTLLGKCLLATDFLGFANRGYGIRMDHPNEDSYLTQWHQDYCSQLCSPSGIVLWSPLRDVSIESGPVCFCPGSHKEGIFKIKKSGPGSYGLNLSDEEAVVSRYSLVAPEVAVGDVLVLDFKTLHCSSPNRSSHTRWAMISRYFNFFDPVGIQNGWVGGLQEGTSFEEIHPELVTSKN